MGPKRNNDLRLFDICRFEFHHASVLFDLPSIESYLPLVTSAYAVLMIPTVPLARALTLVL
jgi:hypothetical protein